MATSNRERIDQGFQLLGAGLKPFVESGMRPGAQGRDWVEVLDARNNQRRGTHFSNSPDDPRFLLSVITDESRMFRDKLSRAEQSFASELRDTGNKLAHGTAFSADDAYRALDTMERLLTAVDATTEADAVRKLRRDAQAAALSSETRRAVQVVTGVEGLGLKPWREVITPHKDVRDGKMRGAEFAADLYWVSKGDGSREYVDPVEFFRRTYLTDGLRELLAAAARRIGGDRNASPVWNLQTNFGGGKTHSMLALYHLLSGTPLAEYPDEVRKVLGDVTLPTARRAVLVGNHIKAGAASIKPDGTEVKTLWGELAWQLGFAVGGETEARRAYEVVRSADETRSNPADSLGTLIISYAPCLILIDEWVAYARQLYGRDDLAGGTFDTQFTFAQTLTEVVKAVPGALLVVSIPASSATPTAEEAERGATDIEVGGLNGAQALARLQQVIHRIADQWRPASHLESFAIVRQRLFEDPGADAQADIGAVARVFTDFYAKNRAEFPSGVADPSYEERIKSAYPLHPELFDRLYHDWSTLDRFQRTRGVLRLMSAVIHELWERDDPAPLILPGGVPLDADDVLTEISQYLEDSFKPVIDADIDGASSTPARIDASRSTLGTRKVTRRLARAIFLGSAPTLKAAHRGIERQHIWLGIATPGDTIGNFANALSLLSDQATYLYSEGARYWYSVSASVQKMARERADRLKDRPEETWAEILDRLRAREMSVRGMFTRVQAGPERSDDIPDEAAVRLVIVHPQFRHARGDFDSTAGHFASMAAQGRGTAHRLNRNMVIFLAVDAKRYEELDDAVRQYLAWKELAGSEDRIRELELPPQQAAQARKRLEDVDKTVNLRISASYQWLLVPAQTTNSPLRIDELKADTNKDRLAERASDRLRNADMLRAVQGAENIRLDLDQYLSSVWSAADAPGHVAVGKLWEYYCQYPYLPRLTERVVLERGINAVFGLLTWETQGFAVAAGYDSAIGRYTGLALPHEDTPPQLTDSTLLVRPDLARAQREADRAAAAAAAEAARRAAGAQRTSATGDTGTSTGDVGGTSDGGGSATGSTYGSDGARRESGTTGGGTIPRPGGDSATAPLAPKNVRFYGTVSLDPERYTRDFGRLYQEVIQHLAATDDVDLKITVEIEAVKKDGYPDDKARIVSENARTLKFDQSGFEDR
ncbi:MAG TPA: Swt1 family HEPN domain-containing protein [Trebonia sp.]|jgi:predicted AAA+ superfamily ATPase|nr:Swt1 family HEPN domain-containing protein [Trebonia sp.]